MSIKDFELFHGAVLTKLVRSDRPITLRMIETNPDTSWSVYTLNDEVHLFIKYSISPRSLSRGKGGLSWVFTFRPEHISEIKALQAEKRVFVALVGGRRNIKQVRMEICLLTPDDFARIIDLEANTNQTVTMKYIKGAKNCASFATEK